MQPSITIRRKKPKTRLLTQASANRIALISPAEQISQRLSSSAVLSNRVQQRRSANVTPAKTHVFDRVPREVTYDGATIGLNGVCYEVTTTTTFSGVVEAATLNTSS
uniref:BIG2 domain-containing protein n=1 Tax=Steinernema glaseri TaxID=37863 RepID=A0A1I7ZG40_9BILA